MNNLITKLKITGFPKEKEYNSLSFGRKIEYNSRLKEFKESAKSVWISKKRISAAKAIKEAKDLYNIGEFYCQYHDGKFYSDDVFELFYKEKA
jgi:hypothetical protein